MIQNDYVMKSDGYEHTETSDNHGSSAHGVAPVQYPPVADPGA